MQSLHPWFACLMLPMVGCGSDSGAQMSPRDATIVVVVSPSGAAGFGSADGDDRWILGVAIEAWRAADGVMRRDPLYLTKERLSRAELHEMQRELAALRVVRLQLEAAPAIKSYESGYQRFEARIVASQGEPPDAELEALANELRKPVIIQDEFFGELQLDRALNSFQGRRGFDGISYDISLGLPDAGSAANYQEEIAAARSTITRIEQRMPHYRDRAVNELFDSYNEQWRADEEPELTRAQFEDRLRLDSVQLRDNGEIFMYLDAGDLFGGHVIEIRADTPEAISSVGLAG